MRFIQHPITNKLIPAEEYERPSYQSHSIHGDISSFVSPVDGSIITDRKGLREHNRKNGVVNVSEFSKEHYEQKAKERANAGNSREEIFSRKQSIYNSILRAEQS
jgi:hypothetical protein